MNLLIVKNNHTSIIINRFYAHLLYLQLQNSNAWFYIWPKKDDIYININIKRSFFTILMCIIPLKWLFKFY